MHVLALAESRYLLPCYKDQTIRRVALSSLKNNVRLLLHRWQMNISDISVDQEDDECFQSVLVSHPRGDSFLLWLQFGRRVCSTPSCLRQHRDGHFVQRYFLSTTAAMFLSGEQYSACESVRAEPRSHEDDAVVTRLFDLFRPVNILQGYQSLNP
ncbi:hypothetical protein JG687_00009998 [Phytophthora cactorum]|uniref:Uncharacterized protein n=1 Tax=Phytophthora cactorum TaxID=29920 RepID=A0A8T1U813_9STRA|nr:hypothetical protein JG687_00009998 [Phytophthora cactorum]